MRARSSLAAIAAAMACLHGCGGGGGSDSPPPPPPTYTVGGAVSGLTGAGLTLTNNGGNDLAVGANGNFTFSTAMTSGTGYSVEVKTQPTNPHQTCVVTNGTGAVGGSNVTGVSLGCTTNNYAVGGTVEGLAATGLVLRLNNSLDLAVGANGSFEFPGSYASGANYTVTVRTQPIGPFQTCVATNGAGVIAGSNINTSVSCTTDMFSVGGTVTGLAGSGLVLQLNDEQDLSINADGSFAFPDRLLRGTNYRVSIRSQTATHREVCAASSATGAGTTGSITNVRVTCAVVAGFVYASRAISSEDEIYGYGFHPVTGALLPARPEPLATVGRVRDMVVAPDGATLYVNDRLTIHAFAVDDDKGMLTEVGEPVELETIGGAYQMVISSSGGFLYVVQPLEDSIALLSIDSATGELSLEGNLAAVTAGQIAISPDGAFLYKLSTPGTDDSFCNCLSATLTTYTVDAGTGALTEVAALTLGDTNGLTIDPLGRFLYVRDDENLLPGVTRFTTIYPFSITAGTGALTAVNVSTRVSSNGFRMIGEPTGRFAYLVGGFNYVPEDNHVDAFSIEQSSGALIGVGSPPLVSGVIASDSSGRFLFVGNRQAAGTFDPNAPWHDGSTLLINRSGPSAGQLSGPGTGPGFYGTAVAVVE